MFAETSDAVQITTVVVALIGAMFSAYLTYLLNKVHKTAETTHRLVNSERGHILRTSEISARALYIAKPSKQTKALLDEAVRVLKDHESKQSHVDKGDRT